MDKRSSRRYCSVPGCLVKSGTMFLFPRKPILREKWRIECKIERNVSNFMSVCCRHFTLRDMELTLYGKKRLKTGSVPSLHLPEAVFRRGRRNCAVHGCWRSSMQDVSLHFFPKSQELRMHWMMLCQMTDVPSRDTRICSDHFQAEDFKITKGRGKILKSGISPSLNLPVAVPPVHLSTKSRQLMVLNSSCQTVNVKYCSSVKSSSSCGFSRSQQTYCERSPPNYGFANADVFNSTVSDALGSFIKFPIPKVNPKEWQAIKQMMKGLMMKSVNEASNVDFPKFSESTSIKESKSANALVPNCQDEVRLKISNVMTLIETDARMKVLTGVTVEQVEFFSCMLERIIPDIDRNCELSMKERVILTLCKLRVNMSFDCLSIFFGVTRASCGRIFISTIHLLALFLAPAVYWLSAKENLLSMSKRFRTISDIRMAVNFIDISVDSLECFKCYANMCSHYRGTMSGKILIGVALSGLITFRSKFFEGSASHKSIFIGSDLLKNNMLDPFSDALLVQESLGIDDYCKENNIKLYHFPVDESLQQREHINTVQSAEIANASIVVRNTLKRLRDFKIFSRKISWSLVQHIDDIVTVVLVLVNFNSLGDGQCSFEKDCLC